jgi:hypothetical protein
MPPKKPRLSLTKAQLQTGLGAELLALCQAVTADGTLTNGQIAALRQWLEANRSCDLPAIGFLVTTLDRILADGKATAEERKELYAAIETVLPPEARRSAVAQRKAVEAEQKVQARQEREAQKQQERWERERQRPLDSVNFMVAGVHYESRPEVIREYVEEGDPVFLVRDPKNKFSRNAVEVRLRNGMQIGFVPEDDAPDVAPLLDQGYPHVAHVTKVLSGGRVPIPVVQAYLYRKDAKVEGLVFPEDAPPKRGHSARRAPARSAKGGCTGVLLLVAVPLALVVGLVARLLG